MYKMIKKLYHCNEDYHFGEVDYDLNEIFVVDYVKLYEEKERMEREIKEEREAKLRKLEEELMFAEEGREKELYLKLKKKYEGVN